VIPDTENGRGGKTPEGGVSVVFQRKRINEREDETLIVPKPLEMKPPGLQKKVL